MKTSRLSIASFSISFLLSSGAVAEYFRFFKCLESDTILCSFGYKLLEYTPIMFLIVLILGIMAFLQCRKNNQKGKYLSVAGIALIVLSGSFVAYSFYNMSTSF